MQTLGFALFDTAIGPCGIAWGERGIVGVQLPEKDRDAARRRLTKRFPQAEEAAPPPEAQRAIDAIRTLLAGENADLSDIPLDMERVPEFNRRVYEIARSVAPGATLTYGEIAERLGDKLLARDVGQAMGQNPFPIVVPCHRVLAAGGKIGGFSANGGIQTKRKMLAIESAHAKGEPTLFDRASPSVP
jgi:methylated-DNA-[protein]-cysteine S-methyltransferase